MKLKNLAENNNSHTVGIDLDVASRLGPTINKHLVALETLSKLLPNSSALCNKIEDLKHDFEACVSLQNNVLEKNAIDIAQLTLEQQLHSPVHPAVKDLEVELKALGKSGKSTNGQQISDLVKKVAEKNSVTINDLNKMFMSSHGNATPHHYITLAKDGVLKETQEREFTIDDYVASSFVIEMYETMKPGLGDKAWVAISKRLRAEGYDQQMVENIINRAIYKVSHRK